MRICKGPKCGYFFQKDCFLKKSFFLLSYHHDSFISKKFWTEKFGGSPIVLYQTGKNSWRICRVLTRTSSSQWVTLATTTSIVASGSSHLNKLAGLIWKIMIFYFEIFCLLWESWSYWIVLNPWSCLWELIIWDYFLNYS
jgi:hypothetical protein